MAEMAATPIVLIHGIKGSHLAQTYDDSFDVIWSAVQKGFETIHDLELDERGEVERDPFDLITVLQLEKAAYGEILGRLRKEFRGVPVYIFRYDWRQDLANTAQVLDAFLKRLTKKTGSTAFRFVTHSMGGLVLAAFLKRSKRNLARVERAALAAPPFWGAVEAVRGLVVGEASRLGIHGSEAFRKIGRTFPSAYQLVPGYPKPWVHPNPQATIWNIRYWQRRVKMGARDPEVYKKRDALMQKHLRRAREFHQKDMIKFDALPEEQRRKFLLLYGTGEQTRVRIQVKAQNKAGDVRYFFDFDADKNFDKGGDGTVPAVSAERFQKIPRIAVKLDAFSPWWPTLWDDKFKIQVAGFHAMFLGLDKVQGLVVDWLSGRDPEPSWVDPIKP